MTAFSTRARWLDAALIGFAALFVDLLFAVVFWTHPGESFSPQVTSFVWGLGGVGAVLLVIGLFAGYRGGWRIARKAGEPK